MEVEIKRPARLETQLSAPDGVFSDSKSSPEVDPLASKTNFMGRQSDNLESDDSSAKGSRRSKRSRRKGSGGLRHQKKRYRPYHELSWDERSRRESQERRRATKRVEHDLASGRPRAPYNTTQFLMEEHEKGEDGAPLLKRRMRHRTVSECAPSRDCVPSMTGRHLETNGDDDTSGSVDSDSFDCDSEPGPNFEENDFSAAYNDVHSERLFAMTKQDLVKEVVSLEAKLEFLARKTEMITRSQPITSFGSDVERSSRKKKINAERSFVRVLQQEICQLKKENCTLQGQIKKQDQEKRDQGYMSTEENLPKAGVKTIVESSSL